MKIAMLVTALSLAFASTGNAQDVCWTPDEYELPLVIAKMAEAFSLDQISATPIPLPHPTDPKDILDIADVFGSVGINVIHIRSLAERASLPGPLPDPGFFAWPLPPSEVMAKQAMDLQQHTLWLLERLSNDLEAVLGHGSITPEVYADLNEFREGLIDQISNLPVPLP